MKSKIVIITFCLLVCCAFSQESLSEIKLGEIAEISETAEVVELEIQDDEASDTTALIDIILADTSAEALSRRVFAYITLSPRIGNDRLQKDYAAFLNGRADTLLHLVKREAGSTYYNLDWYQPAVATGVSFNLETGIMLKVDEKTTVNIGAGFSFDRMRAVCSIEHSRDSSQVLRATSLLVNNTVAFSLGGSRSFDTTYFRINGVEEAGIYGGAMLLFSRYFERDTINTIFEFEKFAEKRRKNYSGVGAAGRIGLFARQEVGERSFFEYSVGYLIRITSGFNEFWENREWQNRQTAQKISSISNGLELSFTLIF